MPTTGGGCLSWRPPLLFPRKGRAFDRGRFARGRGLIKKTKYMKRITLHFTAYALFAPCLLAFTAGSLFVNASGAVYMAGLVYACSRTERGKRFARMYYDEITRLEKSLSE